MKRDYLSLMTIWSGIGCCAIQIQDYVLTAFCWLLALLAFGAWLFDEPAAPGGKT